LRQRERPTHSHAGASKRRVCGPCLPLCIGSPGVGALGAGGRGARRCGGRVNKSSPSVLPATPVCAVIGRTSESDPIDSNEFGPSRRIGGRTAAGDRCDCTLGVEGAALPTNAQTGQHCGSVSVRPIRSEARRSGAVVTSVTSSYCFAAVPAARALLQVLCCAWPWIGDCKLRLRGMMQRVYDDRS